MVVGSWLAVPGEGAGAHVHTHSVDAHMRVHRVCHQVSLYQGGVSLSSPTARVGSRARGEVITLDQHAHLRDVKLPLNALSAGCVYAFALGQHAQVRVLAQPLVPAHAVVC